ncbi:MAG: class I SAM-dependent methyltransferase [Nocardioides sp.]
MSRISVAAAYDGRAEEYIDLLGSLDQMADTDRATILAWRDSVEGRIVDAGCGPGHWTDLLCDGGRRDVVGLDASRSFIAAARRRFQQPSFARGDLAALPFAAGSVGGVLAWFSIIHTPPDDVSGQLRELARVLAPGGALLLGFFDGEPRTRFDHAVTAAYYWSADALADLLAPLGLDVEQSASRQDPGARRYGHLVARHRAV